MIESYSKMRKLTFTEGLPLGTCATFTHEGQRWFAYPQKKVVAVGTVMDKMLGLLTGVRRDLLWWINAHPEDAAWVVKLLARVNDTSEIAKERADAWTMRGQNCEISPEESQEEG